MARIRGTSKADSLQGTRKSDVLQGLGGDDELLGGAGKDQLIAGRGADTLDGGPGDDTLDGGDGDDSLILGSGDTATGGQGADTFRLLASALSGKAPSRVVIEDFGVDDILELRGFAKSKKTDFQFFTTSDGIEIELLPGKTLLLAGLSDPTALLDQVTLKSAVKSPPSVEASITPGAKGRFELSGEVTSKAKVAKLFVSTGDVVADVSSALKKNGSFSLSKSEVQEALGVNLGKGAVALTVFAEDAKGKVSLPERIMAELDAKRPVLASKISDFAEDAPANLTLDFSEAMRDGAFSAKNYVLKDKSGDKIEITSVDRLADDMARLNFAETLLNDSYELAFKNAVRDIAGNQISKKQTQEFDVDTPTRLVSVSPTDGTELANLERHIVLEFDRALREKTVKEKNIKITANGEPVEGRLMLSGDGKLATFALAPDTLFPASSNVRIEINGNKLRDKNGRKVDVDGDGAPGGKLVSDFSTVSVTPVEGTGIFGFIYDSNNRAPDGSDVPLVGVKVSVIGLPGVTTVTDENGRFELDGLPFPDAYLHLDATEIPAADRFQFGTIVKPAHTVAGQMTQIAKPNGMPFDIYFAAIPRDDAVEIKPGEETTASVGEMGLQNLESLFPDVDRSEWEKIKVTVPADSLTFDDGAPAEELTVMVFEPDRIPPPLPEGCDPEDVFTVMAGGAGNLDGKAQIDFPNLDGLDPVEKRP
ncbi:MAG: Ig-like domain-containing protein, partial [Ruegeria sp.]